MTIRPIVTNVLQCPGCWKLRPLLLCLCLGSLISSLHAGEESGQARQLQILQKDYAALQTAFASEMEEIARLCESQSYLSDAEQIRQRAQPQQSRSDDVDALPTERLPPFPETLSAAEREWRSRLRKCEQDYASKLYRLARESLQRGHASLAFELVREVAYHDPDHANARKMLGFVLDENRWTTPFARSMQKRGYVDDPQLGWLPERNVERYQKGERLFDGRWMPAAKEAALRTDFHNAWEVETEHFHVRTNHSLERGVEIARALENYHAFFLRNFTAFFSTPLQMQKLFDGGSVRVGDPRGRFRVNYFRNKEEFIAALRARQPNVEMINGLYIPSDRTAYFYFDEDERSLQTIYHEVTHQLLGESTSKVINVGETSDFWVIEGIACYLESFDPGQHPVQVGDPRHIRIFWARRKAVEENVYVPMRKFTALGKNEFQYPADTGWLHTYYSQAAGMVHFFLHYEEGLYRDAFIDYLSQIYSPADRIRLHADTLEELTEVRFETLDQQYLAYLRTLPADPPPDAQLPDSRQ